MEEVDLFLKSRGNKKYCIVIELKIDAADQVNQIERYQEYVMKNTYENYRIIYLTLDGHTPSEQSMGKSNKNKIIKVSFFEDIVRWLDSCIEICVNENIEYSFIQQYRILLKKLQCEDNMQRKIAE